LSVADDIELIERAYAAWNRGDVDAVVHAMSESVEVHPVLGDVVAADSFHGHDGVRRWYETIQGSLDDFRADLEDVVETGDGRYLVRLRFSGRGRASGAEVSLEAAHLITMCNGLVTRLTGYPTWDEGVQAARIAQSAAADRADAPPS
jgi:ketosteroid isomerase-like protein